MALLKRNELLGGPVKTEVHTVLGPGAEFSGKLIFKGCVRIDGVFNGEIHTDDLLIIGNGAQVDAQITTGALVVHGDFRGSVSARDTVELKRPAKFYGDISSPGLIVEQGAVYEGKCKMSGFPGNRVECESEAKSLNEASIEVLEPLRAYSN